METKKDYNTKRASLAQMLKEPSVLTPIQEVRPVEPVATTPAAEADVKISGFWGPPDLAKRLKVHAAESGKTIREISIEAYRLYFEQVDK